MSARRRVVGFEPLESRLALTGYTVDLSLTLTKPDGSALTTLSPGEDFVLHASAQDIRDNPHGVFAAYMDVTWDANLAAVTGPIRWGVEYGNGYRPDTTISPGLIDEAGGFSGGSELGGSLNEVFSVPMRASAAGTLSFVADPPDRQPQHAVLEYNSGGDIDIASGSAPIPNEFIHFGTVTIDVGGTYLAGDDIFNVNEDATSTIDPLANDFSVGGATNALTIASVGPTEHGGQVVIAADGKTLQYTPAANFNGTETFTYTARNQDGETHTSTVTMHVADVNDPPIAHDDTFNVAANSTFNSLDVLANDSTFPDIGETLLIKPDTSGDHRDAVWSGALGQDVLWVGRGDHGGTFWTDFLNQHLYYSPATGFVGTERFDYSIADRFGGGLSAHATLTLRISGPAPKPDTISVPADSTLQPLDVLKNDHTGGQGDHLTIVSVTQPAAGSVAISPDGQHLLYDNAAGYNGAITFSYGVTNSAGQYATAGVTLDVGTAEPGVTLDGGVLQITGSDQHDMVNVWASRRVLMVMGTIGDTPIRQSFRTSDVQRIEAALGGGNDLLSIAGNVRAAVLADGGDGNDTIIAGGGSTILLGGEGNDRLIGGNRRDLIIGGAGQDQISGGGQSDILIGGTTAYDGDQAALLAIQAQWNVRATRATRIASLRDGTGSVVQPLGVSLQKDATVFDDGEVDAVFGQGNVDWVFGEPGGGQLSFGRPKKGGW